MSLGGTTVSDDCIHSFNDMKSTHKYGYLLMSIKGGREIVVDEKGEPLPKDFCTQREIEEFYNKMKDKILEQEEEPKYIVFNFRFIDPDYNQTIAEIALINWCPENSSIRNKMLYSINEEMLRKSLKIDTSIQAKDKGGLKFEVILPHLTSKIALSRE